MAIGPIVRRLFGPFEAPVANAYRGLFVNLAEIARAVRAYTNADSILEVGCGEGAMVEQLVRLFPDASITGIDISPRTGRLYRGDFSRVQFLQTSIESFAALRPAAFYVVLVCDVLHHVPPEHRRNFLMNARRTVRSGGLFVLKEWERRPNLVHLFGYLSDRWLTGDAVRYATADELRALVVDVFGRQAIEQELRFSPWQNNLAFFVRP
jgi:2-polyprenyl-3-methyl-5-hydroxy-6-metoxy-1,4-benzoquinol methylase